MSVIPRPRGRRQRYSWNPGSVRPHGLGGLMPIAPQALPGDLPVLDVRILQAAVLGAQHPVAHHLVLHGAVEHDEVAVLRGVDEHLMKGVVLEVLLVALAVGRIEVGNVFRVHVVTDAVSVVFHRVGLDAQPRFKQLADVGQRHGVDEYALLGVDGHQLLLLQAAHGVSHRRPAGLEALAQRLLRQHCAGKDLAGDDLALQVLIDDLLEALAGPLFLGHHGAAHLSIHHGFTCNLIIMLYTTNVNTFTPIQRNIFCDFMLDCPILIDLTLDTSANRPQ